MKYIISFMLLGLILSGCATQPATQMLTSTEQKDVSSGKSVKFYDKKVDHTFADLIKLDNSKLPNGISVCAFNINKNRECYPQISKLVESYLSKNGIKIAKDKESADEILSIDFGYAYGNPYNTKPLMASLEDSLTKGDGVSIDEKMVSNINVARDGVEAVASAAAIVLIGAAGGQNAFQVGTNLQQIGGPVTSAPQTPRIMAIELCEYKKGDKPCGGQSNEYRVYRYIGPMTLQQSFPALFDEAMKDTVSDIVAN